MRRGKQIAQGAHASHMALGLTAPLNLKKLLGNLRIKLAWLKSGHKKIAVSAVDEQQLIGIYTDAHCAGLPVALVRDNGHTEFHGVPTLTAVCIGPALSSEIDLVTKGLPLL